MANYATLKAAINAVIKANGQREITGTVLNQTLNAMVNSLGANYQLAGVATPSTNPGTPDQNVFYLAFEAGTYSNFNATVLSAGISIFMWNGSWSSQTLYTIDTTPTASSNNLVSSGAVFDAIKTDGSAYDVSEHFPTGGPNSDGKFTLEYILSNANTLIPVSWRKGGMSIRFVDSYDNKYVQYRLMSDTFSPNESDWQGVAENANIGGNDVVNGNGIATELLKLGINTLGWTKNGINYSTGEISPNNDRRLSELVPIINECLVQIEDVETITSAYGIVWYDEYKEFISGIGWLSSLAYDITSNAPSPAKYFRIFVNATKISSDNVFVFTKGSLLYNNIKGYTDSIKANKNAIVNNFNLFATPIQQYNSIQHDISNAVKELYIDGEVVSGLKLIVFRRKNIGGSNDNRFIIGTGTSNSDVNFLADISEPFASGTRLYTVINGIRTIMAIIDWDAVNFNYSFLYNNEYILNANIYSHFYASAIISSKIYDVIPKKEKYSNGYIPVFIGGFNIDGSIGNSRKRFGFGPILSKDVETISAATGYEFSVFGNNEGINYDVTLVSSWATSQNVSNFEYRYIFVTGRRTDNANFTNVDDLNEILTVVGYVNSNILVNIASDKDLFKLQEKLGIPIIVDQQGHGDYTSLQDAIDSAGDSAEHPRTIIVMPGVYTMPEYDTNTRNKGSNRYLSIIGTDKNNCIIRNDVGHYTTNPYVDNSVLKLAGNVYVANLTIISTDTDYPSGAANDRHKAYCIHLDFEAPQNTVCEINNCVLVNNHFSCIGFGLRPNYTIKIINCELTSTMHEGNGLSSYGTLYGHDGGTGSTTQIQQHLFVKGCVITNTNGYNGIAYLNSQDYLVGLTFINNVIDVPDGHTGYYVANTASKTKKCFGNNISSMNYQS